MQLLFPAVAATALCASSLAAATATPDVVRGVSAVQLFALAQQAENDVDPQMAETLYRALVQDPNVDIRNEARFRHAQLLVRQHKLVDAAVLYRAILDEKPEMARVRLELAALLAQMGDLRGARMQLRQAQAGGLPPDVAQVVNQYVAALRSLKPWGGSFELALAPDSNINRATDAKSLDTVIAPLDLSSDARRQSAIGFKGSGQVYGRADLSGTLTLIPRLSSQAAVYDASRFNDISASAQIGVEWRSRADRLTPSVGQTWRWYGSELYARTQSASLDWLHPLGKRAQISASTSINRARYVRNELQDGTIYTASIAFERAITERSGGSITLAANRQTAQDPGYATASATLGLVYWHDIGKVTLIGTANLSRLKADKRLFLFTDRRREWFMRGGIAAVFRRVQLAGFAPIVRLSYERNQSTVGIYEYRRIATDIGVTHAF